MIVAAVGTLVVGGRPFVLFWLCAAVAIVWEWQNLLHIGRPRARFVVGAVSVAIAGACGAQLFPEIGLGVLIVGALAVGFIAERGMKIWAGAGVVYAGALILAICALKPPVPVAIETPLTTLSIVWLFAVVWGTDIMAYFGGRLIGGPKLWPRVSAGKTWSGTLVGVASGAIFGLLVARSGAKEEIAIVPVLLVGLCAAALSQAGDLLESSVKRRFGVKDSSRLIPGHGGVMDRLDGFIAAAVFAALLGAARGWPAVAEGLFQWR
ncbi:MAG: CDP-archaeol synthase [Hyphomicrobiales bacterium]|nr:CDP-archaeol synthase [Hyphomicrobiales bacterium]